MCQTIIAECKAQIISGRLADAADLKGCSLEDIGRVEKVFNLSLPLAYKHFLREMGCAAGKFLRGSDFAYPALLNFRESATRMLRSAEATYSLSSSDFVFFSHQGYSFLFFDVLEDIIDPPVYLVTDSEQDRRRIAQSFTEWLRVAIEDDISALQEFGDSPR